jgi:cytoskeleton protein RodZ
VARGGDTATAEGESSNAIPFHSLGTWLRTQREARGVSLAAVAESSKISTRHLEALEGDHFDALPAPVFVRGFLREYARIVGLDADEVVNFYLLVVPAKPPPITAEKSPKGDRKSVAGPSWLGYGLLVGAILTLFLGIAGAISFWAKRHSSRPPAIVAAPRAEVPPPAAVRQPAAAAPAPHSGVAVPVAPAAPALAQTAVPAEAGASALLQVVLEFEQDCWVEVVVDGRRRASELKAGGETLALEAKDSVVLTLGNAPAVRVELNGRAVALPMQGTRVVKDFRIDRALLGGGSPGPAAGT